MSQNSKYALIVGLAYKAESCSYTRNILKPKEISHVLFGEKYFRLTFNAPLLLPKEQ